MILKLINKLFFRLSEQPSLISELYEYFKDKYFTPDFGDYANFSVNTSSNISFQTLIFGLFIGINLASLAIIFDKRVLGNFVRKLISEECLSPASAKTLSELGYMKNSAVRGSLRSGITLRKVVRCVEEEEHQRALAEKRQEYEDMSDEYNKQSEESGKADEAGGSAGGLHPKKKRRPEFRDSPFKINFESARFYIPHDLKYMADIKFEKKGTNWLAFFIVLILSFAIMLILIKIIPDVLQMIDNFLGIFSG